MSERGWTQNPHKSGRIQYWTGNAWLDDGPEDASLAKFRSMFCECVSKSGIEMHPRLGSVCRSCQLPVSGDSESAEGVFLFEPSMLPSSTSGFEYLVITMKDRFFGGKFDPSLLQEALNAYAREGWRLRATTTADIPGLGGARNEIIFILERHHGA